MKYKISSVIQWTVKRRMIEACLVGVGNNGRGHAEKNMTELCWGRRDGDVVQRHNEQ